MTQFPVYDSEQPTKIIGYVYQDEYGWTAEAINSDLSHSMLDSKVEAIQVVHETYDENLEFNHSKVL